jgi:hypothetical protein
VIDLDQATLDRVLPSTPGPADWDDVMGRSRVHVGRRRRHLVVLAAVALLVVGTASAFGVRALILDKGFIGLPPEGATPSTPENGELAFSYSIISAPFDGNQNPIWAWVYADGRLIWLRTGNVYASEGANPFFSGLLEQRLTPAGVELLRAEAALGEINILEGERPPGGVPRLWARLSDPASWLPASAWQDQEIRAYVPSEYAVCFESFASDGRRMPRLNASLVLPLLPPSAERLLGVRGVHSSRGTACSDVTTEEASALAEALENAGLEQGGDVGSLFTRLGEHMLVYRLHAPSTLPGQAIDISFQPYLPHGETAIAYYEHVLRAEPMPQATHPRLRGP